MTLIAFKLLAGSLLCLFGIIPYVCPQFQNTHILDLARKRAGVMFYMITPKHVNAWI